MPHCPLDGMAGVWRQDLRDREPRLTPCSHEDAGHQREVEAHVAFVATDLGIAEVLHDVGGPLIGLGQQHRVGVFVVDHLAAPAQELVGAGQVLAVGALLLEQVGHCVQAEPVDAQVEPEPHHVDHRVADGRVLEVQIRLVREEAVPEVLLADRVEGPVGRLGVDEDDPGIGVAAVVVGPHVEVAVRAVRIPSRFLEPLVRIGGVVQHQVGDHPDPAGVRLVEQRDEVLHGAELRQHVPVVGDVVAAVTQRRVVERWQPQAIDAQPGQIVELLDQPAEISGAIAVGVVERPHQYFVEHRALVPARFGRHRPGPGEVARVRFVQHLVGGGPGRPVPDVGRRAGMRAVGHIALSLLGSPMVVNSVVVNAALMDSVVVDSVVMNPGPAIANPVSAGRSRPDREPAAWSGCGRS